MHRIMTMPIHANPNQGYAMAGLAALLAFSIAMFVCPASTQSNPSGVFPDSINAADVAYTLSTTAMQLLLTPGMSQGND